MFRLFMRRFIIACRKSGWNVFDVLIVGSALLAPGIDVEAEDRLSLSQHLSYISLAITFISSARVLRVLRILRAFRALRRAQSLEGLRTVARTILMSIPGRL